MKKLIILILLSGTLFSFGQITPPDYKKIEKAIADKNSDMYYPKLMERYKNGDTTFTAAERQHLYYGFVFQPEYHPYSSENMALNKYLKNKPTLNDEECRVAIQLAKETLQEQPFNTIALNILVYCYNQLDSAAMITKYNQLIRTMTTAIVESGNGLEPTTAFFVNEVSHEYLILSAFSLFPKEQSVITIKKNHYDILELAPNDYGIEKLYYNINSFYNKGF